MGEKAQVVNKSSPKKTFKWLGSSHKMKIDSTEQGRNGSFKPQDNTSYLLGQLVPLQKTDSSKCWPGGEQMGTFVHCWPACKVVQLLCKFGSFSKI